MPEIPHKLGTAIIIHDIVRDRMDGILNETTEKVHKRAAGPADYRTTCGATYHVPKSRLQRTSVDEALTEKSATRCGRCFAGAGGY